MHRCLLKLKGILNSPQSSFCLPERGRGTRQCKCHSIVKPAFVPAWRIHSKQTNQNAMHVSNEWTLTQTQSWTATATATLLPSLSHSHFLAQAPSFHSDRRAEAWARAECESSDSRSCFGAAGFELYNSPREQQLAQSSTGFRSVRTSLSRFKS